MLNPEITDDGGMRALLRRFGEVDWDFPAQASESGFSAFHWHPCRFPSQIPAIAIGRFSKPGGVVLDPFMGSATTLVEAQRLERGSVGVDINPISCLLAKAKTLAISQPEIRGEINRLKLALAVGWDSIDPAAPPITVQANKWYMPETLLGLNKIWATISGRADPVGVIGKACFSAILLGACREDRHWGYVCDNTQPKGERAPNPRDLFVFSLERLSRAYEERDLLRKSEWSEAVVIHDDAAKALRNIPDDHFDCVVTSPPYFGVADYVKAQRLSMEWFAEEIEPFRQREIGARSKRHRTNALQDYLSELRLVFEHIYRVMRSGAVGTIVFGQSPSRSDAQPAFLADLESCGFKIELTRERQIPIGRRQKPSLVSETVIVIRK